MIILNYILVFLAQLIILALGLAATAWFLLAGAGVLAKDWVDRKVK